MDYREYVKTHYPNWAPETPLNEGDEVHLQGLIYKVKEIEGDLSGVEDGCSAGPGLPMRMVLERDLAAEAIAREIEAERGE